MTLRPNHMGMDIRFTFAVSKNCKNANVGPYSYDLLADILTYFTKFSYLLQGSPSQKPPHMQMSDRIRTIRRICRLILQKKNHFKSATSKNRVIFKCWSASGQFSRIQVRRLKNSYQAQFRSVSVVFRPIFWILRRLAIPGFTLALILASGSLKGEFTWFSVFLLPLIILYPDPPVTHSGTFYIIDGTFYNPFSATNH